MRHVILMANGCWIYDSARPGHYARVNIGGGQSRPAHAVTWEHYNGPVPDGLELDHLCREPRCINPLHVEPVPHRVNVLRGESPLIVLHREQRCAKGHPASESYRRRDTGRVVFCRTCRNERRRAARQAA